MMKKTIKILLAVLLSTTTAKEDIESIVMEMRIGMGEIRMEMGEVKESLAFTEKKLLMTQDELLRTKEELLINKEELKKRIQIAEEDQKITMEGLHSIKEDLKDKEFLTQELGRDVAFLKDTPWTLACGASGRRNLTNETLSYDNLLYSSTNVAGAGLDISTGVFTAEHSGSYTATWSLVATDDAGDHQITMWKNEEECREN